MNCRTLITGLIDRVASVTDTLNTNTVGHCYIVHPIYGTSFVVMISGELVDNDLNAVRCCKIVLIETFKHQAALTIALIVSFATVQHIYSVNAFFGC